MVQAEGGLDGEHIVTFDGDPASRPREIAGVLTAAGDQGIKLRRHWLVAGAMLTYQSRDKESHGHASAQRQAEKQQQ